MADNTRQQLFSLSPTSSLTHFPFSASLHALPPTNSMPWLLYMALTRLAATSSSFFFDRCSRSAHPTRRRRLFSGRTLGHPPDQEWPVASVLAPIRKSPPTHQALSPQALGLVGLAFRASPASGQASHRLSPVQDAAGAHFSVAAQFGSYLEVRFIPPPDYPALSKLPMINHSSGFQIQGGNFYEVAGNVNLQTHQHLTIQGDQVHQVSIQPSSDAAQALDGGPHEPYGRNLTGVLRNVPNHITVRSAPYGALKFPSIAPLFILLGRNVVSPPPLRIKFFQRERTGRAATIELSRPVILGRHIMSPRPESAPEPKPSPVASAGVHDEPENSLCGQSRYYGPSDRLRGQTARPIHGGTFITAENVNHSHGETGITLLHHTITLEALYDSADSFPQARCHPETRLNMLDDLYKWATRPESRCSLRWLHGPAGAGKSAIMQTLCRRLDEDSRLGGSFFFKRGHANCGNAKTLFATLAYQLALHNPLLTPLISGNVEITPSVLGKDMEVQLRKLIVEPCQSLKNPVYHILLIDGLDECEGPEIQELIIGLLRNTVRDQTYPCRLRILIASRPEPHIREKFEEPPFHSLCDSVNIEQSFVDVRRYFCDEFLRIRSEHKGTMGNIPTPWPSQHIINALVEKSSGYFIYAATVIKFVGDKHFRPTEQLELVQNLIPISIDSDSPFQALDQLYIQILSGVPPRNRPKLCDILCVIANLRLNPTHIEQLLDLRTGDVQLILRCLHSLLEIPVESSLDHWDSVLYTYLPSPPLRPEDMIPGGFPMSLPLRDPQSLYPSFNL
ncbi:hypothetical protein B0H13DRAFT_2669870 [Mycena leptocephala]|nr:hypothetical protein B0H13DRAFT_2669870 [Mycena leptocephala]